jgi:ABC-type antimicrobial peptide transport system permease subunit
VKQVDQLSDTVQEIGNVLIHLHNGLRDFRVSTNEEDVESFHRIEGGFYVTGFAIGAVTLMIGGVGIMNLMLASINERMREIGLRKALGARNSDIFFQVLTESIILCSLGGFIGIGLGFSIIPLLQMILLGSGFSPVYSWSSGIIGFVFSILVGVVAGMYPAWQAARLDPIEALRYE